MANGDRLIQLVIILRVKESSLHTIDAGRDINDCIGTLRKRIFILFFSNKEPIAPRRYYSYSFTRIFTRRVD